MGFEPIPFGIIIRSTTNYAIVTVTRGGIEPTTTGLKVPYRIPFDYLAILNDYTGNRTQIYGATVRHHDL